MSKSEKINHLQINNYKSIRRMDLDCNRINVFIGEPNVGKSNILEALSLYHLSSLLSKNQNLETTKSLTVDIKDLFRVRKADNLFHFNDISKEISIIANGLPWNVFLSCQNTVNNQLNWGGVDIAKTTQEKVFVWGNKDGIHIPTVFDNDFNSLNDNFYSGYVLPYRYKNDIEFHDKLNFLDGLMPPYGNNLANVIRLNYPLQVFLGELLKDRGIEIHLHEETGNITILSKRTEGLAVELPYKAMSDTFKRMLFYIAAIKHPDRYMDIITLEEPEVHSFPSYVSYLGDEIIDSPKQFFIVTHSPYLLNNLIENTPKEELAVFVCGYDDKDFQTIAKRLSQEDLSELIDYGIDIFLNLSKYLNDRVEHRP